MLPERSSVRSTDAGLAGGGTATVKGSPATAMTFEEIAKVANHKPDLLPDEIEPGLEATRRYRAPDPGSFSNALHGALVETGAQHVLVTDLRLLARLAAFTPVMHLATFYGGLGQCSGLVEACRPQPLVQADLVVVFLAHLTL